MSDQTIPTIAAIINDCSDPRRFICASSNSLLFDLGPFIAAPLASPDARRTRPPQKNSFTGEERARGKMVASP
jgi:hypothetical protein